MSVRFTPFVQIPPIESYPATQQWTDNRYTKVFTVGDPQAKEHWNFLASMTLNNQGQGAQVLPIVFYPKGAHREPEVVLISQNRHTFGLKVPVVELPGGGVKPGSTPRSAARSELSEETHRKYDIDSMVLLGPTLAPDPAVARVQVAMYAAKVHPNPHAKPEDIHKHCEAAEKEANLTDFNLPLSVFANSQKFYAALNERFGPGKYLISGMVEAARARLLLNPDFTTFQPTLDLTA